MKKVLSTKLNVEYVDRFAEMAKQGGESVFGQLRRLVMDYLDGGSKADSVASTGTSNPANSSKEGLLSQGEDLHSEYLPPVHPQPQTKTQECASVVDSGLPMHEDVDHPLNPPPLPTSSQSVYHNAEPGRPATSPKQSLGKDWLIVGGIVVGSKLLGSTTAVDRAAKPVRRKPIMGEYP